MSEDKRITLEVLFNGTFMEDLGISDMKMMDPKADIAKEEGFVGEMNDVEKRVYSLSMTLERMANLLKVETEFGDYDKETSMRTMTKAVILKERAKMLKDLLWCLIGERFPVSSPEFGHGVREGFKIVTFRYKANSVTKVDTIKDLAKALGVEVL